MMDTQGPAIAHASTLRSLGYCTGQNFIFTVRGDAARMKLLGGGQLLELRQYDRTSWSACAASTNGVDPAEYVSGKAWE